MFGGRGGCENNDYYSKDAIWVENDMINLEDDDDYYYPVQARSVAYVENQDNFRNPLSELDDNDCFSKRMETEDSDRICENIEEENIKTDYDYEPRPLRQVPNQAHFDYNKMFE